MQRCRKLVGYALACNTHSLVKHVKARLTYVISSPLNVTMRDGTIRAETHIEGRVMGAESFLLL